MARYPPRQSHATLHLWWKWDETDEEESIFQAVDSFLTHGPMDLSGLLLNDGCSEPCSKYSCTSLVV